MKTFKKILISCCLLLSCSARGQEHLQPSRDIFSEWPDTTEWQQNAIKILLTNDAPKYFLIRSVSLNEVDKKKFYATYIVEKDGKYYVIRRESLSGDEQRQMPSGEKLFDEYQFEIDGTLALRIRKLWIYAILHARYPDYSLVESRRARATTAFRYYSAFVVNLGVISAESPETRSDRPNTMPSVLGMLTIYLSIYATDPRDRNLRLDNIENWLKTGEALMAENKAEPARPSSPEQSPAPITQPAPSK